MSVGRTELQARQGDGPVGPHAERRIAVPLPDEPRGRWSEHIRCQ